MKDFYRFDERRQLEEPPKTFPTTEFLKGINYLGVDLFLNSLLFAFQINGFIERKDFLAFENYIPHCEILFVTGDCISFDYCSKSFGIKTTLENGMVSMS